MVLCTPKYNVYYHGELHPAGKAFEVDANDAEAMKTHGVVTESADEKAEKKTGKSKKQEA